MILLNGIEQDTQQTMDALYKKYDMEFAEFEWIQLRLEKTMMVIKEIYDYIGPDIKCFKSKIYFYTLFATVYHQLFGITSFDGKRKEEFSDRQMKNNMNSFLDKIVDFENEFNYYVNSSYEKDSANYVKFIY